MQNFWELGAEPPHCKFLASRLNVSKQVKFISLNPNFLEFSTDLFRIIDVTTAAYEDRIFNS